MPAIGTQAGQIGFKAQSQRVWIKANWFDDWARVPWLWCESLRWNLAPTLPRATFRYRYGPGMQPGDTNYQSHQWPPFGSAKPSGENLYGDAWEAFLENGIDQLFVRVQVEQEQADGTKLAPIVWHGVITDEIDDPLGAAPIANSGQGAGTKRGRQRFVAYGMELLLKRRPITTGIVSRSSVPTALYRLGRPLVFNGGSSAGVIEPGRAANRSNDRSGEGPPNGPTVYVFSHTLDPASSWPPRPWTAKDICEHALYFHGPRSTPVAPSRSQDTTDEIVDIFFQLAEGGDVVASLDFFTPLIGTDGRNCYDVLNDALDRRRALSWYAAIDDAIDTDSTNNDTFNVGHSAPVTITPVTFNPLAIILSNDGFLAGNTNVLDLDFRLAFDVLSARTHRTSAHQVDRVRCRGRRRTAVVTMSGSESTLEADWSSENETAYDDGAQNDADYGDLNVSERRRRNREARSRNELARVFQSFRVPTGATPWDTKVGGTVDDAVPAMPPLDPVTGQPDDGAIVSAPMWIDALRFESFLPLYDTFDYSTDDGGTDQLPIDYEGGATEGGADNTPEHSRPKYLAPFAVFAAPAGEGSMSGDRWQFLHQPASTSELDDVENGPRWAGFLRMQPHQLGVDVSLAGAPPHLIAADEFTGDDEVDEAAEIDWNDILFTLAIRLDDHVEACYPPDADIDASTVIHSSIRERLIEIDDARLDYVAPQTVLAIDAEGELVRADAGGFVRDDRAWMEDVARIAYEWQGSQRVAFDLTIKQTIYAIDSSTTIEIGHLIGSVGDDTLNTTITSIEFNLDQSTTKIRTDFGELDAAGVVSAERFRRRGPNR